MIRTSPKEPYKGLKRTLIRKISTKQAKRKRELAKIKPPNDGRCQDCRNLPDWRGLAKHHIIFLSQGGKDNLDNIEWLCGKCHHLRHHIIET